MFDLTLHATLGTMGVNALWFLAGLGLGGIATHLIARRARS